MSKKHIFIITVVSAVILLAAAALIIIPNYKDYGRYSAVPSNSQNSEKDFLIAANAEMIDGIDAQLRNQAPKKINKTDNFFGSLNAPVQVIIYEDLTDISAAEFSATIEQIKKDFSDKVVLAVRPFFSDRNVFSVPAFEAAECAADQNKFWEMRNRLLTEAKEKKLNPAEFPAYAEDLGLNVKRFEGCLEQEPDRDWILKTVANSENISVYGSPTTFVNNEIVVGARKYEDSVNGNGEKLDGLKNIIINQLEKVTD